MKQGAKTVDTSLDTGERAQKNEMNLNYEGKDDEISETIPAIYARYDCGCSSVHVYSFLL